MTNFWRQHTWRVREKKTQCISPVLQHNHLTRKMVADQNVFVCKQEEHFICPFSEDFILYYSCTKKITNNHDFNCNNKKCTYKQDESLWYNVEKVHYKMMKKKMTVYNNNKYWLTLVEDTYYNYVATYSTNKIKIIIIRSFDNGCL